MRLVQEAAFFFEHPGPHLDSFLPQNRLAFAIDQRVGVKGADNHPPKPVPDNGLKTGGCFTVMGARLQIDVNSRSADVFPGIPDGVDLGVVFPVTPVIAPADDAAVPDDNRPHHRVGAGLAQATAGKPDDLFHIVFVKHG